MMQRGSLFETFKAAAWRFALNRSGATSVEYAILASVIAIVVAAAAAVMSGAIEGLYSRLDSVLPG